MGVFCVCINVLFLKTLCFSLPIFRLVKPSKKSSSRHSSVTKESSTISKEEEAEAEGLTQLVPEIQRTVEMVKKLTSKILAQRQGHYWSFSGVGVVDDYLSL